MELSKRLYAVASLVTEGASVADIGTDHGYIPIYLIEHKISPKVIAMDINKGPLERARIHIAGYGYADRIETRLSDGLAALAPGEVDEMITAGMGGGLVIHILEEGQAVVDRLHACILQPQSEIDKVRRYLLEHGFEIVEEEMVEEEGKYYPMMRVVPHRTDRKKDSLGTTASYEEWDYLYGRKLLEKKHPVLQEYLRREIHLKREILKSLSEKDGDRIVQRRQTLEHEITIAEKALDCYR